MNENSYFSDITELFLKAKKAENIEVNPHSKAAIREMLSYKIEQQKRGTVQDSGESFWSKWKKTLIGVPASVLAVFVIVFALQNAQISVPQEDFSPTTESAILNESDIMDSVSDSAVIQDIEKPEERSIKIEPLVIDYGDKPQITPTSKVTTTTNKTTDEAQISPKVSEPKPLKAPQPEITETTQAEPSPEQSAPKTGGGFTYINKTIEQPANTTPIVTEQIVEPVTTTVSPVTTVEEIPTSKVKEIIDDGIIIQTEENLNIYREPISPIAPDIDKSALEKLQITDNLSTVNVHYLNEDQAAVEVTNPEGTRWYMIEEINGTWTVTQKFD